MYNHITFITNTQNNTDQFIDHLIIIIITTYIRPLNYLNMNVECIILTTKLNTICKRYTDTSKGILFVMYKNNQI